MFLLFASDNNSKVQFFSFQDQNLMQTVLHSIVHLDLPFNRLQMSAERTKHRYRNHSPSWHHP